MSTAAGQPPEDHYSFEDYLALEERSELRHELVAGRVVLMSGGTRAHDQAAFYLAQRLNEAYSKAGCAVFPHNRKVVVDTNSYYPDVFVHCGPGGHEQYEVDAVVVVEVLSPSSALRDRREKAAAYVRLPSLKAYVVVDPDQPRVEVYQSEHGAWTWRVYGPGMIAVIDALQLDVDQLYDWVAERA
ncbi:MAG TPA: Uma2 family endonuclease [Kineosporiaceae bacterium]|nr:Uma2 family endonuclease [Kineosporiaceae bacterium]